MPRPGRYVRISAVGGTTEDNRAAMEIILNERDLLRHAVRLFNMLQDDSEISQRVPQHLRAEIVKFQNEIAMKFGL